MNYSIASYIGQEVRRFAFLIKRRENFYNLFTLLEAVLPDMADFDAYPLEENKPFCKFDKKVPGSEDKIFLSIDRVVFTEEMLTKPWENMVIDGNIIKTDITNFQWAVDNPKQSVLIPSLIECSGLTQPLFLILTTDSFQMQARNTLLT